VSDIRFANPLTIGYKENKPPRICLDALKIRRLMVPDSQKLHH